MRHQADSFNLALGREDARWIANAFLALFEWIIPHRLSLPSAFDPEDHERIDVFLNLQNPTWSMERKRAFLLEQGFIEMLTLAFLFHAETDLSVFYKKRCPDQGVNIYIDHLDFRKVNTMEAFAFDNGAGFLTWQNEYFASLIGANLKNNTDILKKIYLTCLTVIVLPLHFLVNFFKKFASDDQKAILLAQKMVDQNRHLLAILKKHDMFLRWFFEGSEEHFQRVVPVVSVESPEQVLFFHQYRRKYKRPPKYHLKSVAREDFFEDYAENYKEDRVQYAAKIFCHIAQHYLEQAFHILITASLAEKKEFQTPLIDVHAIALVIQKRCRDVLDEGWGAHLDMSWVERKKLLFREISYAITCFQTFSGYVSRDLNTVLSCFLDKLKKISPEVDHAVVMPSDDFEMVEMQSTAAYPQFSAKDFSRWISASDTENQLSVLPQLVVHFQRIYKKQDVATSLSGSLLSAASSFFRSAPSPSQGYLDNPDQFLDQLKSIKNVDELDNFLRDLCVQQPQLEAHKVFLSAIVQQYDRERLMKEMISEKRVIDFKRYEQRLLSPDALIAIRDDLYRKICGSMGYVKTETGALSVERRPIFSYKP